MALFYVLVMLTLGYYQASNIIAESIKLKLSTGYVTYAHLALIGFKLILESGFVCTLICVVFYITAWLLDCFLWLFNVDEWAVPLLFKILQYKLYDSEIRIYQLLILFIAVLICRGKIKDNQNNIDYSIIRQHDSIFDITMDAFLRQKLVKISLTSRKVYVGIVYSEQFKQVDLGSIAIIPILSGARDKDSLIIHFDCNYSSVYKKIGLCDGKVDKEYDDKLAEFRIMLRVAEIESISMFDLKYFNDFEHVNISIEE
jgi:hypothetical protein